MRRALRLAGETTVRRSCCRIRIALCGTPCRFSEGCPRTNKRKDSVVALETMLCRQRLLPVTCELAQPKRPIARIVLFYDALMQIGPSPIVALNRAVAVGMAQGPAAGLEALDAMAALAGDSALAGYHVLPSVRGDLLMKMGRFTEARQEIQRAIAMTQNLREQELLTDRLKRIEKAALST